MGGDTLASSVVSLPGFAFYLPNLDRLPAGSNVFLFNGKLNVTLLIYKDLLGLSRFVK